MIVCIVQSKGRKDRHVMLPAEVLDLLRQWWKARPTKHDAGVAPEQHWGSLSSRQVSLNSDRRSDSLKPLEIAPARPYLPRPLARLARSRMTDRSRSASGRKT